MQDDDQMGDFAKGVNREKNLCRREYLTDSYFSGWQWEAFLFQLRKIQKIMDSGGVNDCLEIGRGSGFISAILSELGYCVESLDINANLHPTYLGDISSGNFFHEKRYGLVICAEVLEHIPFEKFDLCLRNIHSLTDNMAFITLPNCKGPYKIRFSINSRSVDFLFNRFIRNKISGGHFWEINYDEQYSIPKISNHIKKYFEIIEDGIVEEYPYHYFYVLRKKTHGKGIL